MANIIFAGMGGQGMLTAGLIVSKAAMDSGKNVTWIPSYGSEMRGGTANSSVKISDGKIGNPFVSESDILLTMNPYSVEKFLPKLRPGGTLVIDHTMVPETCVDRKDIRLVAVEATKLALDCGSKNGANIVMLGALAASGAVFDTETMKKGMNAFFDEKGKNNPKNLACFNAGVENFRVLQEAT